MVRTNQPGDATDESLTTLFGDDGDTDDTVLTGHHYKDPDTCGLYTPGHRIAAEFHDVLQAFEAAFDDHTTVDVVAGGCNGCTTVDDDVDVWANYVAQGSDDVDRLYVGFGARDDAPIGDKLVAYTLVGIAKEHGVPVSWNGNVGHKVCLGHDAFADAGDV